MPEKPTATTARTARRMQRRWPLVSGAAAVVLVVVFGALLMARQSELPPRIDAAWMAEILEHRSEFWTVPSLAMNYVGGGILGVIVIPVLVTLTLLLFRRFWGALFFAVASLVSAGLVQTLKALFGRARPEDILVVSDRGSFPSGHVANAATVALVLAILFPFVAVWIAGVLYTVAMALSRTYLGAHWVTDTVGGMLLGLSAAIMVWAPFAARIHAESLRPHPFVLARRPGNDNVGS